MADEAQDVPAGEHARRDDDQPTIVEKRAPGSVGRRRADHKGPRMWRDFWMLILSGIVLLSLHSSSGTSDQAKTAAQHANQAIQQVQEGRSTATAIQCAVISAFADAGRATISGTSLSDTPFTRQLERLGYPPLAQRQAQAKAAGKLYVQAISTRIDRELEQHGKKPPPGHSLVRADGSINCQTFARLARAPLPAR
jgi:hypothetical protein